MKKLHSILCAFLLLASIVLTTGCKESKTSPEPGAETGYMIGLFHATSETDVITYLTTANSLEEGVISTAGKGEQTPYYAHFYKAGKTHLANMLWNDGLIHAYSVENGRPRLFSSGLLSSNARLRANTGDNTAMFLTTIGDDAPTSKFVVFHVDDQGKTIASKMLPTFQHPNAAHVASAQGAIVNGDKLYIQSASIQYEPEWIADPNRVNVDVYSYPGLQHLGSDTDTRVGGNLYSGSYSSVMVKDEAGDVYSISCASKGTGFNQPSVSGILRIKKGANTFDDSYFFNVNEKGYKLINGVYAGNGKIVGTVLSVTDDAALEQHDFFAAKTHRTAILDLTAKTVTIVNDVPAHILLETTPYLVQDGYVYVPIYTDANGGYIYKVDAKTGTAKRGAKFEGGTCLYLATY